jgi:hypothetical protein
MVFRSTPICENSTSTTSPGYAISDKPLSEQEWVEKHVKH